MNTAECSKALSIVLNRVRPQFGEIPMSSCSRSPLVLAAQEKITTSARKAVRGIDGGEEEYKEALTELENAWLEALNAFRNTTEG